MSSARADSFNAFVNLLEFEIEQLAPYDPVLDGFSKIGIALVQALPVKAFQLGERASQPL